MKALGLTRMFLHASQLSFTWPETGVEFSVNAPLPKELAAVVDALNAPKAKKSS
jgi:23S rRNA pseudouridine955/2504/2580 synthase